MTTTQAEQLAWQLQAARVLGHLLDRAYREHLPVLSWAVGAAGVHLVGRSSARPQPSRRDAIAAWAEALGIETMERRGSYSAVITGSVEHLDTPRGWATVTLVAEIYDETGEGGTVA